MMKCEVNEKFSIMIEQEGTIMDYVDDEFIFIIKDEFYSDYEIKAIKKKKMLLEYVYLYDISIFLLTIDDAIDTSDFYFNIHENDYSSLFNQEQFKASFYLLDKDNIVKAKKSFELNSEVSKQIKNKLSIQLNTLYNEEEFNCNLDGIMNTWEPFELSEKAIVSQNV